MRVVILCVLFLCICAILAGVLGGIKQAVGTGGDQMSRVEQIDLMAECLIDADHMYHKAIKHDLFIDRYNGLNGAKAAAMMAFFEYRTRGF